MSRSSGFGPLPEVSRGTAGQGGAGGSGGSFGPSGGGGLFGGGGGSVYGGGPGGGGSGFTPDGLGMVNGVNEGDGLVTITHDAGTCPEPQPDAQVRAAGGGFVGDDVYNADGAGQSLSALTLRLFTASYDVALENDGNVDDTFTVAGAGNAPGLRSPTSTAART